MPTVAPIQSNFDGGEISPSVVGRVDSPRYKNSLVTCENYVATLQGPLDRRPGTVFVKEVKNSANSVRLVPFQFSTTQAYILEFGEQYIRFYTDYGQVQSGMSVLEVTTPYLFADFQTLSFTQSADTLYIVSPRYAPRKLQRFSATSWLLKLIDFLDGPYMDENAETIYMTPGAATGLGVTFTATWSGAGAVANCITAADGSGKIQVVLAVAETMFSGRSVVIAGVTGTTEANGTWVVDVVNNLNFTLRGSTFVNAYLANGVVHPVVFDAADAASDATARMITHTHDIRGWGLIRGYTNAYTVTVDIFATVNAAAEIHWRLGLWSHSRGYPSCVTFHEDRLCFAGHNAAPQRLIGSVVSDYENFAPTLSSKTVTDANAFSFNLNSSQQNVFSWLVSTDKGLLAGSNGGEWLIRPSAAQEAITPTNVNAKQSTTWGSLSAIPGTQVDKSTIFVQRDGKRVRELNFDFYIDGYRATDLTELADHIAGGGFVQVAYQKVPYSIFWLLRGDGQLVGLTYSRDIQNLRVGWHRHIIGGVADAAGDPAIIESIAVIPSGAGALDGAARGARDDVWMSVYRQINGSVFRSIEYMTKFFEDTDLKENAHFLDAGGVIDTPVTLTAITATTPPVVTATAHGFSTGDSVTIRKVNGMTQVNYCRFKITKIDNDNFSLQDSQGNNINGSTYSVYVSGGTVRKLFSTVSGLNYLEGQTVDILADGAVQAPQVVSSGAIALPLPAATVHIGLKYTPKGKMLRLEAGSADGTAIGKTRRTTRISFLLQRSLGLQFGVDDSTLDTLDFRTSTVPDNQAAPLFTGIKQVTVESDYNFDNQIVFQQPEPLPSKILAVAVQMDTQDRR